MKKIVRGDIFYADLDSFVDIEEKRIVPVLIIQNNISNLNGKTTIIAPILTRKDNYNKEPTHIEIKQFEKIRPKSIIVLDKISVIDRNSLKGYLGTLDEEDMREVDKLLRLTLDV